MFDTVAMSINNTVVMNLYLTRLYYLIKRCSSVKNGAICELAGPRFVTI